MEIICFHCLPPSPVDEVADGIVALIAALFVLLAGSATPILRRWADDVQHLAMAAAVPIVVALLGVVLVMVPGYLSVGLSAAAAAMPLGIVAAARLGDWELPESALCLAPVPRLERSSAGIGVPDKRTRERPSRPLGDRASSSPSPTEPTGGFHP